MEHKVSPIDSHVAGDSIVCGPWEVDNHGEAKDLTHDDLKWRLFSREFQRGEENAVLSYNDNGVVVEEPPGGSFTDGQWQVTVDEGLTSDLDGLYWQRIIVDPIDGSRLTWRGSINITP